MGTARPGEFQLGSHFMSQHFTVYDQDNQRLGFSWEFKQNETLTSGTFAVVVMVVAMLIGIGLAGYFGRRWWLKRKAAKLEEAERQLIPVL